MKNNQDVVARVAGPRTGDQRSVGAQHADVDATTRQRVAQSVLEHGPSTAAALADRLGLTAAAVRRHLDVLVERGLLIPSEQRIYGARGRGRPAKVFALSDAGRADFYSAYDDLAIQALDFLAAQAGPQAVTAFAASRAAAAETRYAASLAVADEDLTPAQALAGALTGDGYVASVRPSALGEQLCQHHCPVAHVAERYPQLCEVETELFSRLLGVHVQRLATIAHGDGVCTTHVPHRPAVEPQLTAAVPNLTPPDEPGSARTANNQVSPDAVPGGAVVQDQAAPAAAELDLADSPGTPRERPFS